MKNPFELVTASKLSAQEAVDLWCDDKRLDRVNGPENCFVNGHRGTGKSMLFRILQHDCQVLLNPTSDPDFLAVYFAVRDTEFMAEELELFQCDSQKNVISESHFSLLLGKELFRILSKLDDGVLGDCKSEFQNLVIECLQNAYRYCTKFPEFAEFRNLPYGEFLNSVQRLLESERVAVVSYICLRLYSGSPLDGPLFLFDTFLGRVADFFAQKIGFPIYFLIDDGDDLPESHTIVLNTWIARRRSSAVFKVSTMFGYKTYETRSRSAIQHPHDFFQYDIGTRYLANASEDYVNLLSDICAKRLRSVGICRESENPDVRSFFPEDEKQRIAIEILRDELMVEYSKRFSGRSIRDNVYRHLTSEYMKRLQKERSIGSYIYSGFETLAILSSGHVRDFILCAQRMFDMASRESLDLKFIPPKIQNEVVREHADDVLEEIRSPKQKRILDVTNADWDKVYNLIVGVSNLFKAKMFSDDSERRVFSFCFQRDPGESVKNILKLAIAEGYLMKGYISRKEGTGRRILYVLTRRLAPAFHLDVSAYSGYLSLTEDRVLRLIEGHIEPVRGSDLVQLDFFEIAEDRAHSNVEDGWFFITPEEAGL